MLVSTSAQSSKIWWKRGTRCAFLQQTLLKPPSGMHLLYLPAYSPWLNPIEEGFSSMKAWIRANRSYALDTLADGAGEDVNPRWMLAEAVEAALTPENAAGWFRHSGYVAE